MGQLQEFTDMTGNLDKTQVNSQNIQNILTEFNRNADQLDALNKSLKIIDKGSGKIMWDGSNSKLLTFSSPVNTTTNYIFLSFFSRDDQVNNLYGIPHNELDDSLQTIFGLDAFVTGGFFKSTFRSYQVGSPIIFTIYYFVIQQPTVS